MSLSETALSAKPASPESRGRISKTIGYFAAFVSLGLAEAALGATLGDLAANTRTALSAISFIFIARALGYLLGALVSGQLYDRLRGHPVMASVLIVMVLMLVVTPLVPLLWLLVLVLLIQGMAQSIVDVGGNTLLVWVHRRQVGPYMNGLHFFFGVGTFLSPLIIDRAFRISGDIVWAYWSLALLIVPVAIWVFVLPSPVAQADSETSAAGRTSYLLVALIAGFFFLFVGAEISFGGWITSYAVAMDLADKTMARYLTSAFWGALAVGRLVAIPVAIRFRPRFILLADLVGCLLSVALILFWPDSLTALWVGSIGAGFSIASIFPTMISLAARHLTVTGQVTSWFIVGASLGSMVVPWLIGQLFEPVGPQVVMLTILVTLVLAVGIFVVLMFAIQMLERTAKAKAAG